MSVQKRAGAVLAAAAGASEGIRLSGWKAPLRLTVWTPQHSPLEALADALLARPRTSRPPRTPPEIPDPEEPTDLAPPPAPHA